MRINFLLSFLVFIFFANTCLYGTEDFYLDNDWYYNNKDDSELPFVVSLVKNKSGSLNFYFDILDFGYSSKNANLVCEKKYCLVINTYKNKKNILMRLEKVDSQKILVKYAAKSNSSIAYNALISDRFPPRNKLIINKDYVLEAIPKGSIKITEILDEAR